MNMCAMHEQIAIVNNLVPKWKTKGKRPIFFLNDLDCLGDVIVMSVISSHIVYGMCFQYMTY
jgi:hypothetical protein